MFSTHPLLALAGTAHNPNPVPTSAGIPKQFLELVKVLPFNNIEALAKTIKEQKGEVAAVIIEPIGYNSGCMAATPEFLRALRELTKENEILLIFDEILSGFRMCPGGAQEYYGVTICNWKGPEWDCPSVFGGKKEIMEHKGRWATQHGATGI
jgi:glutamate-1-semialdehyde 2,1-aminomutase